MTFDYVWIVPKKVVPSEVDWVCDQCGTVMPPGDKTYVAFDSGALAHTYCESCAKEFQDASLETSAANQ
jgi:RNase P subunit RPR2